MKTSENRFQAYGSGARNEAASTERGTAHVRVSLQLLQARRSLQRWMQSECGHSVRLSQCRGLVWRQMQSFSGRMAVTVTTAPPPTRHTCTVLYAAAVNRKHPIIGGRLTLASGQCMTRVSTTASAAALTALLCSVCWPLDHSTADNDCTGRAVLRQHFQIITSFVQAMYVTPVYLSGTKSGT